MKPSKKELIAFGLLFLSFFIFSFFNKSTFDSGDSIQHYLISHYAFKHPELFLNHWGKPFFTIISSPFSLFGFKGIQFFNILVSVLSGYFVYKSAEKLGYKTSYFAIVLLFTATDYFLCMYSGLTEPLFGFILILAICFILYERPLSATIIVSFLPFVRSEGNIILILFALYLLFKKQYKFIPLLFIGTIVISIIGLSYYKDITWVFTTNPYTSNQDNYGKGELLHYARQLLYVAGLSFYILLIIGTLYFIVRNLKLSQWKTTPFQSELFFLIFGTFFGYAVSHSIFWWQGWFHSFGMSRVLIAVLPVGILICLYPVNELLKKYQNKYILPILSLIVVVVMFSGNKAELNLKTDFRQEPSQALAAEMNEWYKANYPTIPITTAAPHIPFIMEKDFFSDKECRRLTSIKSAQSKEGLIVWDNWMAVIENNISAKDLDSRKKLEFLKMFSNDKDTIRVYLVRPIK